MYSLIKMKRDGLKILNIWKLLLKQKKRLPKNNEEYRGLKIDVWLKRQKEMYSKGKLKQKEIDKLNTIGAFQNKKDRKWLENFELLKEYIFIYNKLPLKNTIFKNKKIGSWLGVQKTKSNKGDLSSERLKKLHTITLLNKKF